MIKRNELFLLLLLMSLGFNQSVLAAGVCPVPLDSMGVEEIRTIDGQTVRLVQGNPFTANLNLTHDQMAKMNKEARQKGLIASDASDVVELVNNAIKTLSAQAITARERGEELAKLAESLEPTVRQMSQDNRKSIYFVFAMGVNRLEEYPVSSYKIVSRNRFNDTMTKDPVTGVWQDSAANVASFNRYISYTNRYIKGDTGFVSGSIITDFPLLRSIEMHNLFPTMMDHDMRHVHFGNSSPLALAAMFSSARSQNGARAGLVGAAFESVDVVQYPIETEIAKLLGDNRNMDIEEGMLYIARASKAELDKLFADLGENASVSSVDPFWANFAPETTAPERIQQADAEIDQMIWDFYSLRSSTDSDVQRALIYNRNPGIATDDRSKQHR